MFQAFEIFGAAGVLLALGGLAFSLAVSSLVSRVGPRKRALEHERRVRIQARALLRIAESIEGDVRDAVGRMVDAPRDAAAWAAEILRGRQVMLDGLEDLNQFDASLIDSPNVWATLAKLRVRLWVAGPQLQGQADVLRQLIRTGKAPPEALRSACTATLVSVSELADGLTTQLGAAYGTNLLVGGQPRLAAV